MNLIKAMEKEIEKGNNLVLSNGNIVSEDYMMKSLEKEYLKRARAGELDVKKTSFEEFASEELANTMETQEVITFLHNVLVGNEEPTIESEDSPQTPYGGDDVAPVEG